MSKHDGREKCELKSFSLHQPLQQYWSKLQGNVIFVALVSLIWLVLRTGKKPSRIAYPCQRAAAANVGTLIFGTSALSGRAIYRAFARYSKQQALVAIFVIAALSGAVYGGRALVARRALAASWAAYRAQAATGPVGTAIKGTNGAQTHAYATIPAASLLPSPHRVVSVHDSAATTWPGFGDPAGYTNQAEINNMIDRGVMELTAQPTPQLAWQTLIPYQTGDAVAIKLNFNNVANCDFRGQANMYPNPFVVNAVIRGLESIGVPANEIWITDPSRPVTDAFRSRISDSNVQYFTKCSSDLIGGRPNVFTTGYVPSSSPDATLLNPAYDATNPIYGLTDPYIRPAQVFEDAAYIINIPLFHGHGYYDEVGGVSLGLKNNYGSVNLTEFGEGFAQLHNNPYFSQILGDINANPVFVNKTRLVIGDGIMGNPISNWQDPVLWSSFGNGPPAMLFFSADPIAIESVMFDFIQQECNAISQPPRNDKVERYAASLGLGVLEHWNNDTQRQYSVIDYREVDLSATAPLVSIAVSPSNPSIASGTTQQFTAMGTFGEGRTQDITSTVTWLSMNSAVR